MNNGKIFLLVLIILTGLFFGFFYYNLTQAMPEVRIDAIVPPPIVPPPPPPPSPGIGLPLPPIIPTKVILEGRAHPLSSVTILKDGRVIAVITADSLANFRKEITDITPGIWTFGIWSEDTKRKRSLTFSFTTNIRAEMITTINGIFLSPTIGLDRIVVQHRDVLNILGQTAPQSEVNIFIDSPRQIILQTQAGRDGIWFYAFNTGILEIGSHTARARSTSHEGILSAFSQSLAFSVGEEIAIAPICFRTDINRDTRVNLVDFSILLFWWKRFDPVTDINQDRIVNLTDFSIMMYCWTG